jgi:signal transduction histidine kinase
MTPRLVLMVPCCFGVAFLTPALGFAQSASQVLSNASQVLSLPAALASQGIAVSIRGVVTAAEKYWDGRFFVQDASGGVFVDNIGNEQPDPGDVVEVSGFSHPGAFAPVISSPRWKIVGTAALPQPKPVAIDRLVSGVEDGQRVELSGSVRVASEEHSLLSLDVVSGGCRFHVFARPIQGLDPQTLVGAEIRVRGTAAASFNAQLRQLITVKIFSPKAEDFNILCREVSDPFDSKSLPLNSIGQYRRDAPETRVHVTGIVTYQEFGDELFLMDESGGLRVQTRQRIRLAPGDVVDVAGFADLDDYRPVLSDAVCRKTPISRSAVAPRRASAEELQGGLHHASLITIRARLLDRSVRRSMDRVNEGVEIKTTLLLQCDGLVFSAESASLEEPGDLVSPPIGSIMDITGVCVSEIDEEGGLKLVKLLVPPNQPQLLLEKPGWLTPRRLSLSLTILIGVLVLAMGWAFISSKNNKTLKVLVQERELARRQLQVAHDELEKHVKDRTEQLNQQISARKESELQFKGVLGERTRLAQELHDTLEQTLTGIALQMDTASRLLGKRPEEAGGHLKLARSLVGQGQVEVRRSVWDLRSRALEQLDLAGAISATGRQLTDGTGVRVTVSAKGCVRRLPVLIEDNLLRIAQEALTNVIKHSGAKSAGIHLAYDSDKVVLEIKDDGRGFAAENRAGPTSGHFGLLGISERVKRINGRVAILSACNEGATVRVEIPTELDAAVELSSFAANGVSS